MSRAAATKRMRYGVLVPTLNAGPTWTRWIEALRSQNQAPDDVLILDSESQDDTVRLAVSSGFSVLRVPRHSFNHGGTRRLGVKHLGDHIDVLVCMTQDAVLASPDAIHRLLSAFEDTSVAAAYGRQLPAEGASPIAEHARLFNYPQASRTVGLEDRAVLGFKACFLSNSFAAYRVEDLNAVGGFPDDVILGEDTSVAAKLLLSGRRIRYEATACVIHSHNYSVMQEFQRYFDTGVFHARTPWLLDAFGSANGEGKRYVLSEWRHLTQQAPWLLPGATFRTAAKLVGYRLGRVEHLLPLAVKRRMSMFKSFWNKAASQHTGPARQ